MTLQAPLIWRTIGPGQRVKVRDPNWRPDPEPGPEPDPTPWINRAAAVQYASGPKDYPEWSRVTAEVLSIYPTYTLANLRGPSRNRRLVAIRMHVMYEIRRRCDGISLPRIARLMNRDHTTVMHALREWPKKAAALNLPCEKLI